MTASEATAHARDLAALRERAEVAEAKVAAATSVLYRRTLPGDPIRDELSAALADRPAGGEALTRAPSIGTEPYRGKG